MSNSMRLAVTGRTGQVVSALIKRAPKDIEIIALGRPQLDLSRPDTILATLKAAHCDAIINAAAYTAVDKAESELGLAMQINGEGAGYVADAAKELQIPLLHLSTDYVFDGKLNRPYLEDDQTEPTSAYGLSKLEGEKRIQQIHSNHAILRTSWIYSPYGANFLKTMLSLGETRNEIGVVSDQIGNPTSALDLADALYLISRRMIQDASQQLRGVFHITGQGEASWAIFASTIFETAYRFGRKKIKVKPITTADYPTPANRPPNSRLDSSKLNHRYEIILPQWQKSVECCIEQIVKN